MYTHLSKIKTKDFKMAVVCFQAVRKFKNNAASPSVNCIRNIGNNGSRIPKLETHSLRYQNTPVCDKRGIRTHVFHFSICVQTMSTKVETHDHIHHMNLPFWPLWPNLLVSYSRIFILTLLTILISYLDRNKE